MQSALNSESTPESKAKASVGAAPLVAAGFLAGIVYLWTETLFRLLFTYNANFDAAYVLWQARVGDIAAMWLTMWGVTVVVFFVFGFLVFRGRACGVDLVLDDPAARLEQPRGKPERFTLLGPWLLSSAHPSRGHHIFSGESYAKRWHGSSGCSLHVYSREISTQEHDLYASFALPGVRSTHHKAYEGSSHIPYPTKYGDPSQMNRKCQTGVPKEDAPKKERRVPIPLEV